MNPFSEADRAALLAGLLRTPRVWGAEPGKGPGDSVAGLVELCREWIRPEMEVAEVGCFVGVSTRVLALFAGKVWAVDGWDLAVAAGYTEIPGEMMATAEAEFLRATAAYPNITPVKALSADAARRFAKGSLDAVYIDGAHHAGAFYADVETWAPKLRRPGGLLMGHDWEQVWRYFRDVFLPRPVKVYGDESWVVRAEDIPW